MAPARQALSEEGGFVGVGLGTLDMVPTMMTVSGRKNDSAIISSTLKNGGVGKTAPVCLAIRQ